MQGIMLAPVCSISWAVSLDRHVGLPRSFESTKKLSYIKRIVSDAIPSSVSFFDSEMTGPADMWVKSVEGNFPVPEAVLDGKGASRERRRCACFKFRVVLPEASRIVSAEKHGTSSWTETAKLSVELAGGSLRRYFFKVLLLSRPPPNTNNPASS